MNSIFQVLIYFVLTISTLCIFNARNILSRYKIAISKQNKCVRVFKGIFTVVAVISLGAIMHF